LQGRSRSSAFRLRCSISGLQHEGNGKETLKIIGKSKSGETLIRFIEISFSKKIKLFVVSDFESLDQQHIFF
jgi:hypothetical protein